MSRLLIKIIKFYQYALSFLLGNNCRFTPSCSAYFIQAISKHGCIRGFYLGSKRIFRCHPWCAGGIDEVPKTK
jgi:putative membrane protein insertion efficiency factor